MVSLPADPVIQATKTANKQTGNTSFAFLYIILFAAKWIWFQNCFEENSASAVLVTEIMINFLPSSHFKCVGTFKAIGEKLDGPTKSQIKSSVFFLIFNSTLSSFSCHYLSLLWTSIAFSPTRTDQLSNLQRGHKVKAERVARRHSSQPEPTEARKRSAVPVAVTHSFCDPTEGN